MSKKKNDGFNTPFAGLKQLVKKDEPKSAPQKPATAPRRADKPQSASDEERQFLEAMAGVAPVSRRQPLPVNVPQINARIASEEAEALAQLYDLVAERGQFAVSVSGEQLEGSAPGVDARLLSALKRGEYGFQGQLDLGGTADDATRDAVDRFLSDSKREAKRCVLITHGREIKALDALLRVWLERGRLGKLALAFCSARPNDGGASALYVLLRR